MRTQGSLRVEIHQSELDVARKMLARCVRLAVLKSQCWVLPGTRWSVQRGFVIVCSRLMLSSGATIPGQRQPMWKGMVLMRTDLLRLVEFVLGHEIFQVWCFLGRIVTQMTLLNQPVVRRARLRRTGKGTNHPVFLTVPAMWLTFITLIQNLSYCSTETLCISHLDFALFAL